MYSYDVLGLMSGSSLDGLDMAFCRFEIHSLVGLEVESLRWELVKAETATFPELWRQRLACLPAGTALDLALAHAQFGRYLGELALGFLERHRLEPGLIASHGHTIFHYPEQGLSLQIGDGAALAAATGYPTIDNFRMQDVALGGQGAPLAPIADQLLFGEYGFLLNLGGIANLTCRHKGRVVAFDSTGLNQVLNALARQLGLAYDEDGRIASGGRLIPELLAQAEALEYYRRPYPKSLGNDWVQEVLLPIFIGFDAPLPDKMFTACIHAGRQIARDIGIVLQREGLPPGPYRMLATGGGAHNGFLVGCIRRECEKICSLALEIPGPETIDFKEAVLMALLGALRAANIPNILPSVTGATRAAIGGALHQGWKRKL
ncbi:MAG: anhydro-N-acetylmuramic acid kinase [Phaeodactylibacter sp.]|nr:anhydro-N-acetylmuramic acid kinase [Phaeodactylibacter sp.]MCB9273222.1 anhydro-N-acetylmuramic acid kinase [Lewinellaceae bacterium]